MSTFPLPIAIDETSHLPNLIDRAATALLGARTAAEVLEAREFAGIVYDAAKRAARLAKVKGAHDEIIAAARQVQGDALLIEAEAKRRLADEFDAAQDRGEVAGPRDGKLGRSGGERPATAAEIGVTRKQIHEARILRDAEKIEPGFAASIVTSRLAAGEEASRSTLLTSAKSLVVSECGKVVNLNRFGPAYVFDSDTVSSVDLMNALVLGLDRDLESLLARYANCRPAAGAVGLIREAQFQLKNDNAEVFAGKQRLN
jgi:hypothetical protein